MTQKNQCAGTYRVSGYTRKDNTKVDSYWRTCGAKHEGDNYSSASQSTSKSKDGVMTGAAAGVNNAWGSPNDDFLIHSDKFIQNKMSEEINNGTLYKQQALIKNISNQNYFVSLKYYKLSLDFENQKLYDKENSYIKFKDIEDTNLKNIIMETCDIKNLNSNTDVVIPQYGSSFSNKLINSPEFIKLIKENDEDIRNGKYKNKCISIPFSVSRDLRLTVGHATLYNLRYVDGILCGTFFDGYNFEHKKMELAKELESAKNLPDKFKVNKDALYLYINNNAFEQQKRGMLKNYLIVMPILVFPNK